MATNLSSKANKIPGRYYSDSEATAFGGRIKTKNDLFPQDLQHLVHLSNNPVKEVISDLQCEGKCVESVMILP
jgi:hypothetical protein